MSSCFSPASGGTLLSSIQMKEPCICAGKLVYLCGLFLGRLCGKFIPRATSAGLIIYKPDGIGDLILATSAIRYILACSDVPVVLFCAKQAAELASSQFPGTTIEALPGLWTQRKGDWKRAMLHVLRRAPTYKGWDLISLRHQPGPLDHAVFHILSPRVSYGVASSPLATRESQGKFRWQFSHSAPYPDEGRPPRELRAHEAVLAEWAECTEIFRLPPPTLEGFSVVESRSLIVFPTTRSPLRNYPLDQLGRIITSLVPRRFEGVILCGSPDERSRLEELKSHLPPTCAVHCRVQIPSDVSEAVRLIASSGAVLAMESAPAHIACALDKPGVFLLGGGHHGFFAPWGNSSYQKWVTHPLPCYNCNWQCQFPEPYCITRIQPFEISEAISQLLAAKG